MLWFCMPKMASFPQHLLQLSLHPVGNLINQAEQLVSGRLACQRHGYEYQQSTSHHSSYWHKMEGGRVGTPPKNKPIAVHRSCINPWASEIVLEEREKSESGLADGHAGRVLQGRRGSRVLESLPAPLARLCARSPVKNRSPALTRAAWSGSGSRCTGRSFWVVF